MTSIRVLLLDRYQLDCASLRAVLETEPGIALVGNGTFSNGSEHTAADIVADVVVVKIPDSLREGLAIIQTLIHCKPNLRVVALAEHATSDTLFHLLRAGVHGLLLAKTADRRIADAVRAVYGGGTYVGNDAANIMIPHYLDRRGAEPVTRPHERLSHREREVLTLVLDGRPSSEIAQRLSISPRSVTTYRSRLMRKLGTDDISSLVNFAMRHDLISSDAGQEES